jgi:hypothetical protein
MVVPQSILFQEWKYESDIRKMQTSITGTSFNGKRSASNRVVMLNLQVGTLNRVSMFVAILSKSISNAVLGRDRIHVVEEIPSYTTIIESIKFRKKKFLTFNPVVLTPTISHCSCIESMSIWEMNHSKSNPIINKEKTI